MQNLNYMQSIRIKKNEFFPTVIYFERALHVNLFNTRFSMWHNFNTDILHICYTTSSIAIKVSTNVKCHHYRYLHRESNRFKQL